MNKNYDESKIGKRIGHGSDRIVYMYGENQVIKISKFSYILGKKIHFKLLKDYEICKKYFGEFVVETQNVSGKGSTYVEIQSFVHGVSYTKKHSENKVLHAQLQEIKNITDRMILDGNHPIDLIGHGALTGFRLSNVFVDEKNQLQIIDAALLEGNSVGWVGVIGFPIFIFLKLYQTFILNYLLQV